MRTDWKYRLMLAFQMGVLYTLGIWAMDYLSADNKVDSLNSLLFKGLFFGITFGLVFPYLFNALAGKVFTKMGANIHPVLEPTEIIEKEGPATLFKGLEGVGGKLFLTNKRVIFKSHQLNIQRGQTDIDFSSISGIEKRMVNKRGNARIVIRTKTGKEYQLVVYKPELWNTEINERITR
ncbi:GRAM domain-containing protein [Cyclobacterium jeungdonense]|uniref:GRAM domain-containing protein n=1 Tax=Cyclobacterium jeungdonense TaxID=708087 RepID=A0ABT8CB88_9BACT|nr:GRAM domain-containing protein [Cyclobacterium jeungdonense]MDN3689786.1 GRAM domain-containing protein [Cyclobacterium jeungdonense]